MVRDRIHVSICECLSQHGTALELMDIGRESLLNIRENLSGEENRALGGEVYAVQRQYRLWNEAQQGPLPVSVVVS